MNAKTLSAICFSHIGKRINHEDNFFINGNYLTSEIQKQVSDNCCCYFGDSGTTNVCLYAVSDGMGGHNSGEVASRICVEKLSVAHEELQYLSSIKDVVAYIQTVIAEINKTVCDLSLKRDEWKGMGATLVLLVVCGNECAILNIGDSRAYIFDGHSLKQLTTDHTEGQRLLDLGLLTRKELDSFSARKNLYRYVGYREQGYVLQADVIYPNTDKGVFILCSDGITDSVPDSIISSILLEEPDLTLAGNKIINLAIEADNADNSTLILVPIGR